MNTTMNTTSRSPLYFDDLKVGDTFVTDTFELSVEQIKSFAQQFDPQPFHMDEAAASLNPSLRLSEACCGQVRFGWAPVSPCRITRPCDSPIVNNLRRISP